MAIQVFWNSIDLWEIDVKFLEWNGIGVVSIDEVKCSIDLLFMQFWGDLEDHGFELRTS